MPGITPTGSVGHTTAAISGGEAHELATATATRCSDLYVVALVVGSVPVCCLPCTRFTRDILRDLGGRRNERDTCVIWVVGETNVSHVTRSCQCHVTRPPLLSARQLPRRPADVGARRRHQRGHDAGLQRPRGGLSGGGAGGSGLATSRSAGVLFGAWRGRTARARDAESV